MSDKRTAQQKAVATKALAAEMKVAQKRLYIAELVYEFDMEGETLPGLRNASKYVKRIQGAINALAASPVKPIPE